MVAASEQAVLTRSVVETFRAARVGTAMRSTAAPEISAGRVREQAARADHRASAAAGGDAVVAVAVDAAADGAGKQI